jgi:hypothetical protein
MEFAFTSANKLLFTRPLHKQWLPRTHMYTLTRTAVPPSLDRKLMLLCLHAGSHVQAVSNFLALCQGVEVAGHRLGFAGCPFTRIMARFMLQAGDVANRDGTGALARVLGGLRLQQDNAADANHWQQRLLRHVFQYCGSSGCRACTSILQRAGSPEQIFFVQCGFKPSWHAHAWLYYWVSRQQVVHAAHLPPPLCPKFCCLRCCPCMPCCAGGAHIHTEYGDHFPDEGLDDKHYRRANTPTHHCIHVVLRAAA